MLDISFYSKNGSPPITIEVSDNFYAWLIYSDFSAIGVAAPQKIEIDKREIELDVVDLNSGQITNRQRFREFLVETIVQEVNEMLLNLGDAPSQEEYQGAVYKLKKLQQMRSCIENESYQFLQRVS